MSEWAFGTFEEVQVVAAAFHPVNPRFLHSRLAPARRRHQTFG